MTRPDVAAIDHDALQRVVVDHAAEHDCPAIAWGVVADGGLVAHGAVDRDPGAPVGPDTVFRIASMTKSFSAALTLSLRDDGVLRLDDPIERHAPELAALRSPTADAPPITIRDLLGMTSGLVTDDPWADRLLDLPDDALDRIVADGAVFALPTGIGFEYSNLGYGVLGRVVSGATGRRLQDLVAERLLQPLDLTDTTWVRPGHDRWRPPRRTIDGRFVDELPTLGDGMIAPMGGLWSTVRDLARWVAFLDDAFPARDGDDPGPLRRSSRREMQTPQRPAGTPTVRGAPLPAHYGLGLTTFDDPTLGRVVAHSGGLPGYGSNMAWLPGRRLGVVALSNTTYAPMSHLNFRLLDLLHEQSAPGPATVECPDELADAAHALVALLSDWDDVRADALFAENVAPDDSYERRRAAAEVVGPLRLTGVTALNAARARIAVVDAGGHRRTVTFALAPARPPRIQRYDMSAAHGESSRPG